MILKFLEHFHLREFQQLDEKLIIVGKGKRYGQIMFLAGGAGSGKGFAITNFLEVISSRYGMLMNGRKP